MNVRCPNCENRFLQKSGAGVVVRLNGPITIGDDGVARAACHRCDHAIELPLELAKSYATPAVERIVIVERGHVMKPPTRSDT